MKPSSWIKTVLILLFSYAGLVTFLHLAVFQVGVSGEIHFTVGANGYVITTYQDMSDWADVSLSFLPDTLSDPIYALLLTIWMHPLGNHQYEFFLKQHDNQPIPQWANDFCSTHAVPEGTHCWLSENTSITGYLEYPNGESFYVIEGELVENTSASISGGLRFFQFKEEDKIIVH